MRRPLKWLISTLVFLTGLAAQEINSEFRAIAGPPISGKKSSGVQLLDQVMLKHMEKIGCSSATLAISYRQGVVHSRGYGWVDQKKKIPTRPDTLIGIASCEKPITAAAIRQLAKRGKLNLDDKIFRLLGIRPTGEVIDDRISQISVRNLLEHKAGWQGAPIDRAISAARASGKTDPLSIEVVLSFLMTQRLSSDPGTKYDYCNFCYDTLRHVILKTSKKTAVDYFRTELFRPLETDAIKGFASPDVRRNRGGLSIVWNDGGGGPVSASAPTLCRFMQCFWLTGEPRDQSNPTWIMYGSLPSSTTLMLWRSDGINAAAVFNGRGDDSHDQIKKDLEAVIDRLK
jgi:CubicO group peptidase (beta-lactamase class C family)